MHALSLEIEPAYPHALGDGSDAVVTFGRLSDVVEELEVTRQRAKVRCTHRAQSAQPAKNVLGRSTGGFGLLGAISQRKILCGELPHL